jgi:hypothetical protein
MCTDTLTEFCGMEKLDEMELEWCDECGWCDMCEHLSTGICSCSQKHDLTHRILNDKRTHEHSYLKVRIDSLELHEFMIALSRSIKDAMLRASELNI